MGQQRPPEPAASDPQVEALTMPEGSVTELVLSRIRDIPDFPRPGVLFKDFTPLLADGEVSDTRIAASREVHKWASSSGPRNQPRRTPKSKR